MNPIPGIIFGVPRSGTSWLGQLINSHPTVQYRFQPIHSYTFMPELSDSCSVRDVRFFYDELFRTKDPYVLQLDGFTLGSNNVPKFRKVAATHLIFKETHYWDACERACLVDSTVKLIGLIRDPVDVLSSWCRHPSEFDDRWLISEQWFDAKEKNKENPGNLFGFRAWADVATRMRKLREQLPDQVYLVRYESVRECPLSEVERIFDFLGLCMGDETRDFIKISTTTFDDNPYSVFRAFEKRWPEIQLPLEVLREVRRLCFAFGLDEFLRIPER